MDKQDQKARENRKSLKRQKDREIEEQMEAERKTERDGDNNEEGNTETLQHEEKNILLHLLSQLRIGMDLSRVTLPTFILEPKSFLEKLTDFFTHPDVMLR